MVRCASSVRSLKDLVLGAGRRGRARAQAWPPTGTLRMSEGRSATLRARRKWRRGGGNGGRAGVRLSPFLPHRPSVPLGFNTRAFITSAFTSETETPKRKSERCPLSGAPASLLPPRARCSRPRRRRPPRRALRAPRRCDISAGVLDAWTKGCASRTRQRRTSGRARDIFQESPPVLPACAFLMELSRGAAARQVQSLV